MAIDHRLTTPAGGRIDFSCDNYGYRTNVNKGVAHGTSPTRGSVFPTPLVNHSGFTLWLEHVEEKGSGQEVYWLMWYDGNGVPTIPMSGIFDRNELAEMSRQLAQFI